MVDPEARSQERAVYPSVTERRNGTNITTFTINDPKIIPRVPGRPSKKQTGHAGNYPAYGVLVCKW
jgi:hypothetical protein